MVSITTNIQVISQATQNFSTGIGQTRVDVMPVFTPPCAIGDIIVLTPNTPSGVMPVISR